MLCSSILISDKILLSLDEIITILADDMWYSLFDPGLKVKKGKVHPLYRHWGSVQAVRFIGGVEV